MSLDDHRTPPVSHASTGAGVRTPPATLRFALAFLALAGVLALLGMTSLAGSAVHAPMSRLVAVLAHGALGLLGDATLRGQQLAFDGFDALVVEACNGVLPASLYVAAVIAFPGPWRAKAIGIAIGLPAILLINVVRVVSLMIVGSRWPAAFERVHIFVWQPLVIVLAVALWLHWIDAWAGGDDEAAARPAAGSRDAAGGDDVARA